MLIAATALLMNIKLSAILGRVQPIAPKATCHIRVVSHKFVGEPGKVFKYAGEQYSIPSGGSIELVSGHKDDSYEFNGRTLPLKVFPLDEFGTETVTLPDSTVSEIAQSATATNSN